jgi:hypothetical protein
MYMRTASREGDEGSDKDFLPETGVARTEFHLSRVNERSREDLLRWKEW